MKEVKFEEFRSGIKNYEEVVEVKSWGKLVGTWIPAGQGIAAPTLSQEEAVEILKNETYQEARRQAVRMPKIRMQEESKPNFERLPGRRVGGPVPKK